MGEQQQLQDDGLPGGESRETRMEMFRNYAEPTEARLNNIQPVIMLLELIKTKLDMLLELIQVQTEGREQQFREIDTLMGVLADQVESNHTNIQQPPEYYDEYSEDQEYSGPGRSQDLYPRSESDTTPDREGDPDGEQPFAF
jgi:hypothetical protein